MTTKKDDVAYPDWCSILPPSSYIFKQQPAWSFQICISLCCSELLTAPSWPGQGLQVSSFRPLLVWLPFWPHFLSLSSHCLSLSNTCLVGVTDHSSNAPASGPWHLHLASAKVAFAQVLRGSFLTLSWPLFKCSLLREAFPDHLIWNGPLLSSFPCFSFLHSVYLFTTTWPWSFSFFAFYLFVFLLRAEIFACLVHCLSLLCSYWPTPGIPKRFVEYSSSCLSVGDTVYNPPVAAWRHR